MCPQTIAKGYEVQVTGSNVGTWGTVLNDNMISYVDQNMGGVTTLSLTSTNVALTATQARNAMLRLTGTLLASVVVGPDVGVNMTGFFYWENVTAGSFTVTFTNSAGSVVLPQSRRGVMWVDTTNGPRLVSIIDSVGTQPIPTGTVMLFYQNAAPTGWTISAALNDYALKIVSSAGGVTSGGSVAYSTLFGRTATDSHVLTVPQLPIHDHNAGTSIGVGLGSGATVRSTAEGTLATTNTGSGQGHTHNIDMRVQTASMILATKN
jgi:hypothetical protein